METRIGNIEFRTAPIKGTDQRYIEIICWTPNTLYGKENEFEKDMQDNVCFKEKETYYTVATINIEKHPNVKSCGMHAFQLNAQDEKDFKKLVIYAYQYAMNLWLGKTLQLV